MARVFEESFKIMAVELSCIKGSVSAAALELGIDPSRLTKWRMDPRFNGGNLLPKNDKISPEEQELRELKKRLKESELENEILKKAVAIFSKGG
ncbi:transposase [Sphingobacterium bovisgrunnientis]|jgi:transposase|uniref:transposase n=1 Tax=Sphingobacterium bovisgrunnientis TaxID=1874697 RepID=UPI00135B6936|nr:transposase [Sphingobacterium bovisgrunnientis]